MFVVDQVVFLGAALVLLGILSSKLAGRIGLPALVLFLGIGMLAGSEGPGGIAFDHYVAAHAVGTIALALILFDGGLRTSLESVRKAWKPAGVLATVGVVLTAGLTGVAAAWLLDVPWTHGLLLGSIIASTDAAAVFGILKKSGVGLDDRLASTLEIESGSNDPMAIFLTLALIGVVTGEGGSGWAIVPFFFTQMLLGAVIGIGAGRAGAWVLDRIGLEAPGLYPVLAGVIGLLAFGLAASLGGSGFLAVYLSGVVIGNQDLVFRRGIFLFHDGIAWLAQIVMFTLLGLLTFPSSLVSIAPQGLLVATLLMLVARPVAVFATMPFFGFKLRELGFLSWVGLKGAVPIILAIYPLLYGLPEGQLYFDLVFFVVLVSALTQGWSLARLARALGLEVPARPAPPASLEIHALRRVDASIVDYVVGGDDRVRGRRLRDLPLPEGVLVALVARGDRIVAPRAGLVLEEGDHVFLVLDRDTRHFVDRMFGAGRDRPLPALVEVSLKGSTPVRSLAAYYGLEVPGPPERTLGAILEGALGGDVQPGAFVEHGGWILAAREIERGRVTQVGLSRGRARAG